MKSRAALVDGVGEEWTIDVDPPKARGVITCG
jgi:hypothetical protein